MDLLNANMFIAAQEAPCRDFSLAFSSNPITPPHPEAFIHIYIYIYISTRDITVVFKHDRDISVTDHFKN